MTPRPLPPSFSDLWPALSTLQALLEASRRSNRQANEPNLTETEAAMMEVIHQLGRAHHADLIQQTRFDAPWVSRSARRLAARGFVELERVKGRRVLSLTRVGEKRLSKLLKAREVLWRDVWRRLAKAERGRVVHSLAAVNQAIHESFAGSTSRAERAFERRVASDLSTTTAGRR